MVEAIYYYRRGNNGLPRPTVHFRLRYCLWLVVRLGSNQDIAEWLKLSFTMFQVLTYQGVRESLSRVWKE
jgi:hypothetical protein